MGKNVFKIDQEFPLKTFRKHKKPHNKREHLKKKKTLLKTFELTAQKNSQGSVSKK